MITVLEAGIIAISMSNHLDTIEQAYFVAGFQEAIKYIDQEDKPEERFIKKGDYYLDTKTNLEWMEYDYGPMVWEEAMEFCLKLEGGWGLPSIEELSSLVDHEKLEPATVLPGIVSSCYWSSDFLATGPHTTNSWSVDFKHGSSVYKSNSHYFYIRPVKNSLI